MRLHWPLVRRRLFDYLTAGGELLDNHTKAGMIPVMISNRKGAHV